MHKYQPRYSSFPVVIDLNINFSGAEEALR